MTQRMKKVDQTIRAAGKIALRHFTSLRRSNVYEKSRYERVTVADHEIHRFLKKQLPRIFQAPVLSEENTKKWKKCDTYWVVDPIDGTTNYYTRIPYFCIAIGLVVENQIVLNAVYNPILDELFYAEKGKGAYLNKRKLRKDHKLPLTQSIVGISYSHARASIERAGKIGLRLRKTVHNTRHSGSTVLSTAYTAAGRLEAQVIVGPTNPWDVLPGLLLIEEVNGVITDFHGKPYRLGKTKNIIVSNGAEHKKIQQLVSRIRVA